MGYESCQVCGLKYRGGYARMRCPSCERRHAAMKSRISHIRSKCGVEPVACPICGKTTGRASGFCMHHEAQHRKEERWLRSYREASVLNG